MSPFLKPQVAFVSLITTIASIGTAALSVSAPIHYLLRAHPGAADTICSYAAIIAAIGTIHLSLARSILPSIDNAISSVNTEGR
jgi:hypothetical protein